MYGSRRVDASCADALDSMVVFEYRELVFFSLVLAHARDFLSREPRRLFKDLFIPDELLGELLEPLDRLRQP